MKKRTKIVGLVAVLVTLTGLIFKLLHLPGAGILWGTGILLSAFGFFLMVLIDRFSYEKNNSRRMIALLGYVGAAFLLVGIGMAFMHWPYAAYTAEGGGVLLLIYFVITNSLTFTNDNAN